MKRSEINKALKRMESVINDLKISLPPFCNFTPEEWLNKGHEYDEIRDNMLGWDITDYGLGDFGKVGFSMMKNSCSLKKASILRIISTGIRWKTSSTKAAEIS